MKQGSPQHQKPDEETLQQQELGINERLALIELIDEGLRSGSPDSPVMADLFSNLWDLVAETVAGSKIDRLKAEDTPNGFKSFAINTEAGENIGRLNMLYLKKPIPCYYLVYVEVAPPFRKKGLGNRILEYFRDFLNRKSAVGILDNIIPEDDPTFDIYLKQAWESAEELVGDALADPRDNYMVYVPPGLHGRDLREPLVKLLYHLQRKRTAIDMRENELMVQRTISEFKAVYSALLAYFGKQIQHAQPTPLMRFMFTRFVTKFIAFRRRIGDLLGYTGGDSLEQLHLPPEIADLAAQSYAPPGVNSSPSLVNGDMGLWLQLPDELRQQSARWIESLPNYRRPSLVSWLKRRAKSPDEPLTLGDLMDLGFDPTRLKEFSLQGRPYIFERIQARQLPQLEKHKRVLEEMAKALETLKARKARLQVNPPLLAIRDRGNAYVLRQKIGGIHWEEAMEELHGSPQLQTLNRSIKIDRLISDTVREVKEIIAARLEDHAKTILENLAYFVSWDLEKNRPKLVIDFAATSLETIWVA